MRKSKKFDFNLLLIVLIAGIAIMGIKFYAYFKTGSAAILGDALESLVNIFASAFGLYSMRLSNLPQDKNHPYGHGKIEFFASGLEGGFILFASLGMAYAGVMNLVSRGVVSDLNLGILLSGASGLLNLLMGILLIKRSKKSGSLILKSDGKHLVSDFYSTVALVGGLILIKLTGIQWIDSFMAIIFAFVVGYTGYKLLRQAIAGLLDEADFKMLSDLIDYLNNNRQDAWIDIHNLRVQKYGDQLHVDCHVTLPWYYSLNEVHAEITKIEALINDHYKTHVELFIHADPCLPSSCPICSIEECPVRQHNFRSRLNWKMENLLPNQKHNLKATHE